MGCLVNLYDVYKGILIRTSFLFDLSFEALSPFYTFCKQNDAIIQSYKMLDILKTQQGIKNILIRVPIIQQCYSLASLKAFISDHL